MIVVITKLSFLNKWMALEEEQRKLVVAEIAVKIAYVDGGKGKACYIEKSVF